MSRGLAELTTLAVAMGGEAATLAGLAGMGDLVATCMSPQSRNRHVGEQLGLGRSLDEVLGEMRMVAEGVKTVVHGGGARRPARAAHADRPDDQRRRQRPDPGGRRLPGPHPGGPGGARVAARLTAAGRDTGSAERPLPG